jgi:hypothetical protein
MRRSGDGFGRVEMAVQAHEDRFVGARLAAEEPCKRGLPDL